MNHSPPRSGILYLIPTPLGPTPPESVLPPPALATVRTLRHFVAERAKTARAFLKAAGHPLPLTEILIEELNEHTPPAARHALLEPLRRGENLGLVSEAGCPGIADPGAELAALAHAEHFRVAPLVGPSSPLLALMASGLCGQRFAFHGYLPAKKVPRAEQIRMLERESRLRDQTQIFIETPYRNTQLLEDLIACCAPQTRLCVAVDLTLPEETILTLDVAGWRALPVGERPMLEKRAAIFLVLA
ncbi:MAG: SAM-dependent methyltransferase [Betaproteobacteria bacterium]|nr:SAM-dependent methyltransferase [Betaproteobacteria bacterium]